MKYWTIILLIGWGLAFSGCVGKKEAGEKVEKKNATLEPASRKIQPPAPDLPAPDLEKEAIKPEAEKKVPKTTAPAVKIEASKPEPAARPTNKEITESETKKEGAKPVDPADK